MNVVVEEAQVAYNPISSLYAVKGLSRFSSDSVRPAVNSKREGGRGKVTCWRQRESQIEDC